MCNLRPSEISPVFKYQESLQQFVSHERRYAPMSKYACLLNSQYFYLVQTAAQECGQFTSENAYYSHYSRKCYQSVIAAYICNQQSEESQVGLVGTSRVTDSILLSRKRNTFWIFDMVTKIVIAEYGLTIEIEIEIATEIVEFFG